MVALSASLALPGCTTEGTGRYVKVDGRVTYEGKPLKKATINFLPVRADGLAATGAVEDGVIKTVTTHTEGDGLMPGKYRVTIHAFEETPRDRAEPHNGPTPEEVGRLVANGTPLIPPRYTSVRDSGLAAEVSPSHHTLLFDLTD
jgi:hypothetical protein